MAYTIVSCPHCGKNVIEIREIPDTVLIQRGFTGRKGKVFHRGRDVYLTIRCPACGKDPRKAETISHEEHLKKIKESGMPTRIGEDDDSASE